MTPAPSEAPPSTSTAIPTDTATVTATPADTATATPTASPTATATATATAHPVGVDRVLVSWYAITREGDVPYGAMAYQPRRFAAGFAVPDARWGTYAVTDDGGYAGWDVINPPNLAGVDAGSDWLTIGLNRPARIAVIWRGGNPPSWLAGWTVGGLVQVRSDRWGAEAFPTFWADTAAGDAILGGTGHAGWDDYWVLLAEDGGVPSGDPSPGVQPNAPCPFHPPGYHPHIDPVSWCYHGHEHGTDPANLGASWDPGFGRVASAMGMSENNQGFKLMGWAQDGVRWVFGMHQGTSGAGRLCVRYHTTILAAWDDASGDRLLDLQWMGDYGAAVDNNAIGTCIFRPECPDQCIDSPGVRQIGVIADGGNGYEPWRVALENTAIGLVGSPLFNTLDPVTMCDVASPCSLVGTGLSGSKRFFQGHGTGILNPPVTGEFWTDPTATAFRDGSDADAVRQWIAPGLASLAIATNKVWDLDGFGRLGTPADGDILYVNPTAREGSIPAGGPN